MKEKIHHSTIQKAIKIYLLCILNKNEIKRKSLEDFLLEGDSSKRISFKNVYIPIFNKLNIKISEITKKDKGKGRYNPVYWILDFVSVIDDFVDDFFDFLQKRDLKTTVSQETLNNGIKSIINYYIAIWEKYVAFDPDFQTNFDWKINLLISQISFLFQSNPNLFRYFPIYLAFSLKYSLFEQKSSTHQQLESEWKTKINSVPLYLDIIIFFESMIVDQLDIDLNFDESVSQTIKKENLQSVFVNQIDYIIPLLKNQMNANQDISFLLSPSSPRNEGYWFLLLAIQENFLQNVKKNENYNLPQAIRELKKEDGTGFETRNHILLNCIVRMLIILLDPKFPISDKRKFIFGSQEVNNGPFKPIFSFDT